MYQNYLSYLSIFFTHCIKQKVFILLQDSIYFSVLNVLHGCLNNPGMYIYTYVLNCSRKLKYLLHYNMNLSCCTRKYLTLQKKGFAVTSFLCTLCYVVMETSPITGCSVTSSLMRGHPMDLIYNYRQKAYSLPHKHEPKLLLTHTWQDFKFLLPVFVKKNEITE